MPVKKLHSEDSCNKIGKDYNPSTNRCVKKCGPNQSRDPNTFKCKKNTAKPVGNNTESCKKQGKDYNSKTKRCVKMCEPNQIRDPTTFKCKKMTTNLTSSGNNTESCKKQGKDYNAKTKRCVKMCGPNQIRDPNTFKCKKTLKSVRTPPSYKRSISPMNQRSPVNKRKKNDYNKLSPEYSPQNKTLLLEYYNTVEDNPQTPSENYLQEQSTSYRFDSLLRFVKNHPAKINEKELEKRNNRIMNELRSIRKSIDKNDMHELEQKQKQIEREIEKLDHLMNENVNHNIIIEKQEDVANKIDHLEYMMDQLSAASMSSTISTINSSKYNTPL